MTMFGRWAAMAAGAAALAIGGGAMSATATTTYRSELSPAPHTLATRADVVGTGAVTATLAGRTLTIAGTYSGLPSDATKAHLDAAVASGVPGIRFADLAITGGLAGQISGVVTLDPKQVKALNAGGLSIVIDSVRAPDGNIWGWLTVAG